MKNNRPSTLYDALDIFHEIGGKMRNGLKHKNATNYTAIKTNVESQINAYDAAVANVPITLETIHPLWSSACDERQTVHDMYDSQPALIQQIRNNLMRVNGGGKLYKCPLCEVNYVYHLDHYIPREEMPEFSVHPLNLIYLCQDCNEKKGTKWLNAAGERIIFNAYFDILSGKNLLVCEVDSIVNGMPLAVIKENTTIIHDANSKRELSTIKELEIDRLYELKVNEMLQILCNIAVSQTQMMKAEGRNIDEAWFFLLNSYQDALGKSVDIISRITLQGMCNSPVLKGWLDGF